MPPPNPALDTPREPPLENPPELEVPLLNPPEFELARKPSALRENEVDTGDVRMEVGLELYPFP